MIGTKIYKEYGTDDMGNPYYAGYDEDEYVKCSTWCNETGLATMVDQGDYYEVVAIPAPSLEEAKEAKLKELKAVRDTLEVEPIEYEYHFFDYDEKARDRISAAITALDLMGENAQIAWTTADDEDVNVTANDLRGVIANVAARSNLLHVKYRQLKELVNGLEDIGEIKEVEWDSL